MTPQPEILRYAAFTSDPAGGNPAGLVLDARGLDDAAMLRIAGEVGYAETALRYFDGYYIALDGLAEVRAAQGNDGDAIALLERATSRVPQPASLIDLGDLYAKDGRAADAGRAYRQAESIALRGGSYQSAYRRDLAMFYADHNRQLAHALELAREDLESRPDVYGYDATQSSRRRKE